VRHACPNPPAGEVGTAGALSNVGRSTREAVFGDQGTHTLADVIANFSNAINRLALGIRQGPVIPAGAGDDGTFVAAAHGDEQMCAFGQIGGEALRPSAAKIDGPLPSRF